MTPRQLAALGRAEFRKFANARVARQQRAYFKKWEQVRFYGLSTPELTGIARKLHNLIRKEWTYFDAVEFCEQLMPDRYSESKHLALMMLARYRRRFESTLLAHAKRWLNGNLCDNWAITDHLASRIVSSLIDRFDSLAPTVESWCRSRNLWVRRTSAVAFVYFARRGRHLDRAYRITAALEPDPHDLIQKACGWLLRECGKTDAKRLEGYLFRRGPRIARTTLRYAVEKFPLAERHRILAATRCC